MRRFRGISYFIPGISWDYTKRRRAQINKGFVYQYLFAALSVFSSQEPKEKSSMKSNVEL